MARNPAKSPWPLAGWLLLCAFCNCAGWLLSALRQLNTIGYTVCFAAGVTALFLAWRAGGLPELTFFRLHLLRRRFSRAYPAAFLAIAGLVLLGGLLYPPTNYDGLAYREPRVLHWLAEGRWHWIHTNFQRLNVRACGFEWLSAPFFVFTRTDRLVFLINFVSFLLLPGLIFSIFTRLGIRARAAWHWMWLLPSGYCFVLQAGSIGNDSFSAVFALAALDLALRARVNRSLGTAWLSCLAVGLLAGSKTSNLPFMLPWFLAFLPSVPLLFRRPVSTLAVAIVAGTCSFLPVAVTNWIHCRDWTGQTVERAAFSNETPFFHIAQNSALLAVQNLVPPIFPFTKDWNRFMHSVVPPERVRKFNLAFEAQALYLEVPEMQTEETAGLGLGLSLLLLLTFLTTAFSARPATGKNPATQVTGLLRAAILAAPWVGLLPLLMVSGVATTARYLAPQYSLLAIVLLLHQSGDWIKAHRWWRPAGMVVFFLAAMLVIVSPARPLWPAGSALSKLGPDASPMLKRAQTVYAVYAERADVFAPVLALLPGEAKCIGMVTSDDPEAALWRPFGSRRIEHVLPEDTRQYLASRGIQYVVISSGAFAGHFIEPLQDWLARVHGDLLQTIPLALKARHETPDWYLVKLRPDGPA